MSELDRTTYIGGSDVAAILGLSPWKSPFMLYQTKIGEYVEVISPEKQKIFNRGIRWEPVVIEMLIDELESRGHVVSVLDRNQRYTLHNMPFIRAEIDLELTVDGEECNGEMKTVHPFAAKDWGEQGTDEIPVYYLAQVQHGLMVTGRKKCIVAALIGADDLRVHVVNRDNDIIDGIIEKESAFWDAVQNREPPEVTTDQDIRWLYGKDLGETAVADDDLAALVEQLKQTNAVLKDIEGKKDALSIKVKAAVGNASTLIYEGKPILTWKNNKDSQKIDWVSIADELDPSYELIEKYTKTTPGSRVLRLK